MKKYFFIVLSIILTLPFAVFALEGPPSPGISQITSGGSVGRETSYTATSFAEILTNLVNWFSWFIALVSVVVGLYSAFLFITSAGDENKVKQAKDTFLYAILGIIIAILAFSIVAIAKLFIG